MSIALSDCINPTLIGDRAESVVRPAGDWLFAHWPVIVGPLTPVIGLGALVSEIVQLGST